ncbi:hypothetical protein B0H17DRAFT_1127130, partial [Mycena rosella]
MAFQTTAGLIDTLEAAGAYNLNDGHRAGRMRWGSIWRRLHYRLTSENRPFPVSSAHSPLSLNPPSYPTLITMGPKLRARPQALSDPEPTHSDQNQRSESEEDPTGRPKRAAKSKAMKKKSAAPAGPKPKVFQDFPDPDPVPEAPRKRAASNVQQSAKAKAPRILRSEEAADDDDDDDMASRLRPPPKKRVTKTVVDSDHDGETEIIPARPQPKPKAQPKMKSKGKVALAPVHVDAEDAGFADEEDDHSDLAMGAADEEDEPDEEADDLQGLAADEVERRLAYSVPQWSSNHDGEMLSRPSSRASFSSGHYSVPESNFDGEPIEVSSDSDSDSDPGLRGALSGMRAARDRLPAPTKIITTSRHESQKPTKSSSVSKQDPLPRLDLNQVTSSARARTSAPQKPVGKREAQRAQEECILESTLLNIFSSQLLQRPEWNDPEPSVSRAFGQRSRSHLPSTTIKQEYADEKLVV